MIHISKTTNNQFQVTDIAANGEVLKHSEPIKRKDGAWKHIASCMRLYGVYEQNVQDDTGVKPKIHTCLLNYEDASEKLNKIISSATPGKPHIIK